MGTIPNTHGKSALNNGTFLQKPLTCEEDSFLEWEYHG